MAKKFTRRCTNYYLKLGSKQKSKQKWRKQRGKDSKVRRRHKGRPTKVQIGFGTIRQEKFKIKNKTPVLIKNLKELEKVDKMKNIVIIARVGKKNREEIIKKANESKIEISNMRGKTK